MPSLFDRTDFIFIGVGFGKGHFVKVFVATETSAIEGLVTETCSLVHGLESLATPQLRDVSRHVRMNGHDVAFVVIDSTLIDPLRVPETFATVARDEHHAPIVTITPPDATDARIKQLFFAGSTAVVPSSIRAEQLASILAMIKSGMRVAVLHAKTGPHRIAAVEKLSDREMQVLNGICNGLQNKEIAHGFSIKEVTVKMHVRGIIRKLGARNRTHAAMIARDLGLATSDLQNLADPEDRVPGRL